jgi:hypothetical protein
VIWLRHQRRDRDSKARGDLPPYWYNLELFRHATCIAVDDMVTDLNRRRFWDAFLTADMNCVQSCIRNALTYLTRKVDDARIRQARRQLSGLM